MNIFTHFDKFNVINFSKKICDLLWLRTFSGMKPIINVYTKYNCGGIVS